MASTDWVTVRGGGVFGLACAYEIAKRGVKVRLIERARIGAGSSGGTVGMLSPHVPEQWNAKKQFQFESLVMAQAYWDDVKAVGGQDAGFGRVGRLQPIANEAGVELAQARAAGAAEHWGGDFIWRVAPVEDFGDFVPVTPTGLVIHDTLSGRASPRRAGAALAAAIEALGGEVIIGEAEERGPVLHATGLAGLEELTAAFGKSVGNGVKGQSAILAHDAGPVPQIFADGVLVVPHADGTVGVGSTAERYYDDPESTDDQLEDVLTRARALVPALEGAEVVERWANVRPRSVTRAPMLGAWPGREGHFIVNGGFKIGFGMAPKIAVVMADLVLEGVDTIPEGFRVEDNL
ncbi:glycine/D-amino acid oxidase-like deaminating enzyme [Rhodobacter aestuarii]|uniref:Glycine/D-amino acid oxidase n=1 Tax=Rhodobacter aestuarii TaxID=453582 RepID=A0A1N7KE06_9RHOB|nr:FAD-binding oxidoreductase [Rhodobacter aestuarii]PTV95738.1 glycine/D-amino acid oxidase-like deaminating enzyme [Rhodobacter aestuarii]SIS59835.1 Glycine/D-amino acid oxidase [Rhodobacter aestuarii]